MSSNDQVESRLASRHNIIENINTIKKIVNAISGFISSPLIIVCLLLFLLVAINFMLINYFKPFVDTKLPAL